MKTIKKSVSILLVVMMLCFSMHLPVFLNSAQTENFLTVVATASSDDAQKANSIEGTYCDLLWTLNRETGLLSIGGKGSMPNADSYPWQSYMKEIKDVEICYGVTNISDSAFKSCNLNSIKLAGTVKSIGGWTFMWGNIKKIYIPVSCTAMYFCCYNYCSVGEVYYEGTKEQFDKIHLDYAGIGGFDSFINAPKYYNYEYDYPNYDITTIPDDAIEFMGQHYSLIEEKLSWKEAKEYCENLGGHLATITSAEENNAISSLITEEDSTYWIGGMYESGVWSWVTDEEWSYTNWAAGEPSFISSDSLRVRIDGNCSVDEYVFNKGEWDSCRKHSAYFHTVPLEGFICEWEHDKTKLDYYAEYWDSSKYNGDLVKIMSNISNAVYDENSIRNVYYNTLGFNTFGVYDYEGFFNPNSCGYSFGLKKSQYSDELICLIAVRGSSNTSDWIGNINIDTDVLSGLHLGFANPAKRIMETVQQETKNATYTKIKYFVTGHSRGAATANILSYLLMQGGVSASDIFNYNFACPDVACRFSFGNYTNIFNLCNRTDIVAHVPGAICSSMTTPGTSWGKFGQTYWFTKNEWNDLNSLFDNVIANHEMSLYEDFFACDPEFPHFGSVDADEEFDYKMKSIGWLTKVLCPVDVVITDVDGNRIASVINGKISYYNNSYSDVIIFTDGDKKIIYTHGDRDYNVDLLGTGTGKMVYSVEKYCLLTDELSESKVFTDVELYEGKQMNSPVYSAKTTEDIELFVVNRENNQSNKTHVVNPDGSETAICIQTNEHKDVNADNICDICEKVLVSDDTSVKSCNHICHSKNEFWQFIWKIYNFLMKLFSMERVCSCGVYHY